MTLEDFTTYTEVDEEGTITVTSHEITGSVDRHVDTYVYKDFGAGHFGDFEHLHDAEVVAPKGNAGMAGVWGVSNQINDRLSWTTGLVVLYNYVAAPNQINMYLIDEESTNADYDTITAIRYYHTTKRAGTSATSKYYSDAARTNLIGTLAVTCATTTLRYCYGSVSSDDNSHGCDLGFSSKNLDLQEVPPPPAHFMIPKKYW